ncbi:chromosome segregation protein SMC [Vagococcus lutrae]|uniref:chromosome segregation protein SMC n=1 Tax=Vagococcus lutrae TaxID=81947 RepID=UPI00288CA171|nr:chromosome segregation protein SMC [Vagococcus lutrae]MDT2816763.1 chromosome segregation protein SMC [Vagococcus lutrae]
MYLKKMEIAGFKSFAERTTIEFDQGLTAVVGPNGSGKSNITDAIRWVLGEQSAKNLRGGKMPDVIFSGTQKRSPLNIAEVTLVLDNESGYLPVAYSEISVTRRLSRSGESDFFLNKQRCRLKDIVELFMDSGLGKESFSIISQGKVESIFNSKPEERRGIFEEAAGVLKYKQRKQQAEKKLLATDENLSRVRDIIYELEVQLEPLKAEREKAKQYQEWQTTFKQMDVGLMAWDISENKERWTCLSRDKEKIDRELEALRRKIDEEERRIAVAEKEQQQLDKQLEDKQGALLIATEHFEQVEGKRNVWLERSKNATQTTEDNQRQRTEALRLLNDHRAQQLNLEKEQQALEQQLDGINQTIKRLENQQANLALDSKEQVEKIRSDLLENMQQQANTNNDLKHLEKQYEQETRRNEHGISRLTDIEQKKLELENMLASELRQKQEAEASLITQRETYQKAVETLTQLEEKYRLSEQRMYDAMKQVQQVQARYKSVSQLQDNYSGFYQGVKAVLTQRERLPGIIGALAELISVPPAYTLGIETALGAAAQHIVVEDESSARKAITYLKSKKQGRATFLPLTVIQGRTLSDTVLAQCRSHEGFIGLAEALVSYEDARLKAIIASVLGRTIIAKDLSSANELARMLNFKYRIVSLEGDIINPGGSMTGGATKYGSQGSLLGLANEEQTLKRKLQELKEEQIAKETNVAQLKESWLTHQNEVQVLKEVGEKQRLIVQKHEHQVALYEAELGQVKREYEVARYDTQEISDFLTEYEQEKQRLLEQKVAVSETIRLLEEQLKQANEDDVTKEERRLQYHHDLAEAKQERAVCEEKRSYCESQIAFYEQECKRLEGTISQLDQLLDGLVLSRSEQTALEEQLQQEMQQWTEEKQSLQVAITELREQRAVLMKKLKAADETLTVAYHDREQLLEKISDLNVQCSKAEIAMDSGLNYLQTEYQLTYEAAVAMYPLNETEIADKKRQRQTLKEQIGALGSVNLNAISQYDQVAERYEFLTTQRDDLLEAKETLLETMDEMDVSVKEQFSKVFYEIQGRFRVVFPEMFGGGYADLQLTNPDDLLTTGIEIVAQPPGKKLQNLSLLSGGERALTAIALLFAIIQVRPVPFCVLDEVEAALDEANVARFGRYLTEFENDTQFIVITHRKGTMEAADVLYGITMEESGVSQVVSVKMTDVDETLTA